MNNLLALYGSCKTYNTLPDAGGMLDQSLEMMYWLDAIDRVVNEFKAEQAEREKAEWQTLRRT